MSALGAFAEGRRHGEEALRLATREGAEGPVPITAQGYLGVVYLTQGDLEPAIQAFEQALARCRASGERSELRLILAGLGYAYTLHGRLAEGCALLEEAIVAHCHHGLGRLYVTMGQREQVHVALKRTHGRASASCSQPRIIGENI